jgi:hypothetical protein
MIPSPENLPVIPRPQAEESVSASMQLQIRREIHPGRRARNDDMKAPQDNPYISLPATGSFAVRMSPESDSVM